MLQEEVFTYVTFFFYFRPEQECQKIFQARFPIDTETVKTKVCKKLIFASSYSNKPILVIIAYVLLQLVGFGMSLLQNVDPNPENFVCAGIIKARTVQIGTLLRLEPNRQAQVRKTHFKYP